MATLPKGSLVLVTGANGWIASHVVDQALQAGYNVRGCVRAPEKGQWLVDYANDKYGSGRMELATVPDMGVEGAFDEAVKGVSAFIHVASDLSFSSDARTVVGGTVAGIHAATSAAAACPTVQHFVYTSSSSALGFPLPDVYFLVKHDTWNDDSYTIGMDDSITPDKDPMKAAHVYAASKYAAEKEALEFGKKQDKIVVNTVVPNMNWGPLLAPGKQPGDKLSSGALLPKIYAEGLDGLGFVKAFPPQYHVDVRDTARLHIAPLLDPTIKNERLFAMNEPYDWQTVLSITRSLRPQWTNTEEWGDTSKCLWEIEPRGRAEEVLVKLFGVTGFTGLRQSMEDNLRHVE